MNIVADENIPCLREYFGQSAEVQALNGRAIRRCDVEHADALIVRSVTPVTADLLADTAVRFVGSCTIGVDHVDSDYLRQHGIAFASAPGSNADSAAQYTLSAILALQARYGFDLHQQTVGIVGYGNVGQRVKKLLDVLGVASIVNDPPRAARGHSGLRALDEVLQADIISFHVPLTRSGSHPTWQMLNADSLQRMNPAAMLINCARGDIINTADLRADISARQRPVVLDVWPNEPHIDTELLRQVQIATPHIAGYSLDGKLRGTAMIYRAFCQAMNLPCRSPQLDIPHPAPLDIPASASPLQAAQLATRHAYAILDDDHALRALLNQPPGAQGACFDQLRKHYPVRREYSAFTCTGGNPAANAVLAALGFQLSH